MNDLTQPSPEHPSPVQSTASQPATAQPEQPAKIEYDRLIAYFDKLVKYSLLAITIILSIAAAFLWKNTEDIKNQTAASIRATQESATHEISAIGKAAQTTATAEAQKAIDAAFEKHNVEVLIETTARKKVNDAVEEAVRKDLGARVEAFRSLIAEIGEISNHGAQLRLGYRAGLDYLLRKRESADPTVRAYASSTIKLIAADFEKAANLLGPQMEQPDVFFIANNTHKQLMAIIGTPPQLFSAQQTAWAFFDMKKRVHWDVPTFDIPAAEKWCAAHKPSCDQ